MQNTLLFGQYRIEETIGAGGMAVVYKARHTSLDKYFAIKKLSDSLAQNSEARERFVREAKTHSRLVHPNIVKFHDILQDHATGNVYIVMEYVEGRTLARMIGKETGPIPFEKAWPIFRQLLEGIGYAHSQEVVHRDIKPGNVIVTPDNSVKILDFGIARDETGHTITQSGQVVGTLQYASPEQIKGEKVDQRSDIYNLGMTLYEMLAGRLPHHINPTSSPFHIMQRMLNDVVPDPRNFYPHIPENVVAAIFKAIDKDISQRIGSVAEFLQKLDVNHTLNLEDQVTTKKNHDDFASQKSLISVDTEYEKLIQLSKRFKKFSVRKHESSIELINDQDGEKFNRFLLSTANVAIALFLLYFLFSFGIGEKGIVNYLITLGGIIGLYMGTNSMVQKRKFSKETVLINENTIAVYKNIVDIKSFMISKISNVAQSDYERGIKLNITDSPEKEFIIFKNSKTDLLKQVAHILDEIVKKKKHQLQDTSFTN